MSRNEQTGNQVNKKKVVALLDKWTSYLKLILRDIEFTEPVIDDLKCAYCMLILIQPWQYEENRYCEICYYELKLSGGFPDKFALKHILSLKCYCKNQSKGCVWIGAVHEFEEHSQTCTYVEHKECPYCKIGCNFKGTQEDILKHHETSFCQHAGAICYIISDKTTDCQELIQETIDISKEFFSLKQDHMNYKTAIKNIENKLNCLQKEIFKSPIKKHSEKDVEALQSIKRCHNIIENMKNISDREVVLKRRFIQKDPEETKKNFLKIKNLINAKILLNGTFLMENERIVQMTEEKFSILRDIAYDGYLLAPIDNILDKIETARHFNNNEYNSPYIYTHKFGYKFYVKMNFNGSLDHSFSSPRYISIYIVFVPGEYDEILTFPMPYSFEIKIKNLAGRQDKSYILIPEADKDFYQRQWGDESIPIGFMKFISHEELLRKGYVSNGTIFLEVSVNKETDEALGNASSSMDANVIQAARKLAT